MSAWYTLMNFNIDSNGRLSTTLFDKRDNFDFAIVSTFLSYVVIYHFHLLMVCKSPSWFDTQLRACLRMRTFQSGTNYRQKSWFCRVIMNLVWGHHFANSTVAIMTLFTITNYHWPICWMICFIPFVRLSFPYWLWRRLIPYT
jgi:hypothetical protein